MAAPTLAPTESNTRRILLVSVPRTASNLLVKVLNIHHQPNVVTNEKAGYFFYPAFLAAARDALLNKPVDQWTDSEKAEVRDAYQQCLDAIEGLCADARRDNKIMFTKEHALWFVNPATMYAGRSDSEPQPAAANGDHLQALQEFFRLRIPDTFGPERTFSAHNRTMFPDEYLRTWQFAFIIRHPALAWPSLYRAMLKLVKLGGQDVDEDGVRGASLANMTLTWTRRLVDWCLDQQSRGLTASGPLIVDAHDIINTPAVVLRLCEALGLDTKAVQFEWGADKDKKPETWWSTASSELDAARAQIMLSTLQASQGIVKEKAPATVDIKAEAEKWKGEFGDEVAALIEKAVWDAMPDYEYLRERRLQV